MKLFGHRGASCMAPENTLRAIKHAFGFEETHGCEFDIQRTKDNRVILLHDDTLRRTARPLGILPDSSILDANINALSFERRGS